MPHESLRVSCGSRGSFATVSVPTQEHVDAWIERVERITKWTCPKETRHKVDVLGAKTRESESEERAEMIRRRTPAPKVVKVEEKEERDPSVPQYGPYDVLQYHSGSRGRREFFRIQKAAHARPVPTQREK